MELSHDGVAPNVDLLYNSCGESNPPHIYEWSVSMNGDVLC